MYVKPFCVYFEASDLNGQSIATKGRSRLYVRYAGEIIL